MQEGVLLVAKNTQEYTYKVKITKADNDYCIMSTDINNLSEDDVVSCKKMQEEDYKIGDIITFGESDWYVIKNSTYGDDYLTLLRAEVLPSNVIGAMFMVILKQICLAVALGGGDIVEAN